MLEYKLHLNKKKKPVKMKIKIIIFQKVDELLQQSILKDKRLHCRMDTIEGKVGEIGKFIMEGQADDARWKI